MSAPATPRRVSFLRAAAYVAVAVLVGPILTVMVIARLVAGSGR